MRQGTAYGLIGLNLFLLGVLVGLILVVASIRNDVEQSAQSANLGCKRSNVQRDATRFLLKARVHDAHLISTAKSTPEVIAYYFRQQEGDSQRKLDALVASAALTFPLKADKFLIDCDRSFPLP